MALTNTTEPSLTINSAYDMVVYDYTSDRDGTDNSAVTSVADSGGFTVHTVASHSFVVGDNITGSGFTEAYNIDQLVTAQTATTITTNAVYTANDTGTLTLDNTNFQVGAKLGLQGVNSTETINDVNSGGTTSGIDSIEDGMSIVVLDNDINSTDVAVGDLVYVTSLQTALNGVHIVRIVDGGATSSEISIYVKALTITDTSGSIELLGKVGGGYPEKLISSVDISGADTFRFNFSNILQSALTPDLLTIGSTNLADVTNGIIKPAIAFSEWHDDENGLLVESPDLSVIDKEYTNNIFQHTDTADCDDYKTNASTNDGKFLTNMPSNVIISATEEYQLSIYTPDTLPVKVAYVTYDLNGSAASVAYLALVTATSNKIAIPINTNILSTSISKVDVWVVRDSDNVQLTNKQTFTMTTKCYPNAKRFVWQNERGGMDSFTFTANLSENLKTKSKTYTQPLAYGHTVNDRGASVVKNRMFRSFETSTDYVKSDVRTWLKELRGSDEVYVVEGGAFVPIIVTGGLKVIHDDISMVALNIEYVYANEHKTQLG